MIDETDRKYFIFVDKADDSKIDVRHTRM